MLNKRLEKGKTSKDAIAWMKTACDPFHDFDVGINGIPDSDGQHSVVQIVPKVLTVTAPGNLPEGDTWSLHVTTLPLAQTVNVSSYATANSHGAPADGNDNGQLGVLGTFTLITHADSATNQLEDSSFPQPGYPAYNNTKREFSAVSIDDVGGSSLKKLIAGGFEVHNDTAALYKQGSVTVYQSSQKEDHLGTQEWRALSADALRRNDVAACRQPPSNRAEAASLPSARTWEAAKGCYVPARLGTHPEYQSGKFQQFRTRYADTVGDDINCGYMQVASSGGDNPEVDSYQLAHRGSSIETTGAYFSGLSKETVLTVTVKMIIESAPTAANPTLLYSASPTPDYDPRMLALYYQTIRHLPPGVEVSFNAKGDWFRMVMKAANAAAPVAVPLISTFGPEASLAAETALAVGNASVALMNKAQRRKEQPKKKNGTKPPTTKSISRPNRA